MTYVLLVLAIFFTEMYLSFLLNQTNLNVLTQKLFPTIRTSLKAGTLYWLRLLLVVKLSDWDYGLMISSVIGDTVGDCLVAKRRVIKVLLKKKYPFLWIWKQKVRGYVTRRMSRWIKLREKRKYRKKFPVTTA